VRSEGRKWIKLSIMGLTVALSITLVLFLLPAGVSISQDGFLSITALAASEDSKTEGRVAKDWGYEYILRGLDSVEVGNRETLDFEPTVLLNKWNGECWIRISMPDTTPTISATMLDSNKVSWSDSSKEVRMYALQPEECFNAEGGGFEYEVILRSKPKSNVITLNIDASPNLAFYYQPELAKEEIAEGTHRPEYIIGSYAVYHKTKVGHTIDQTNYQAGKFCHIYRPRAVDSKGWEVWGDLYIDIEHKLMTVILPQEFIDSAVYPIHHATGDTFGFTAKGGTAKAISDYMYCCLFTCPSAGNASSITWYIYNNSGIGARDFEVAIYNSSKNKIEDAEPTNNLPEAYDNWLEVTLDTSAPILAADYWLAGKAELQASIWCYQDDIGGWDYGYKSLTTTEFPEDPLAGTFSTGRKYSVYCTYTPENGEADISNVPSSKAFGIIAEDTNYWSKGSAPTWPLDDDECFFTVTNNGDTCSLTIKATNFTGGDGWTLTSGNPGSGTVRMKAGKSGDVNEDAMVTLTTSEQAFISGLAGSTAKKWEIKLETGTFTDGALKTSTITLTATLD